MSEDRNNSSELKVLSDILAALNSLDAEARQRVLQTVATFYRIPYQPSPDHADRTTSSVPQPLFSESRLMTPKDFLVQKMPRTDIDRVACLAYYLAHYRDTPHFKTLDISQLNTEAAQPKFTNAAYSVENAMKQGYLVPAVKGAKQLSAAGEVFVNALPDRAAAKLAMTSIRPRKRGKRGAAVEYDQIEGSSTSDEE